MARFSLDIEKYYDELREIGRQVKGIFCIQYPIYCIHANIADVTPDPLDNLDRAIVEFYILKSDFSSFQISSLMGTSKSLVEQRVKKLSEDNIFEKDGDAYILTDKGKVVFKEKTQLRQHKQSYDFYIDGITLQPLPKAFYNYYVSKFISEYDAYRYTNNRGETKFIRPFGPDIVHTPLNKPDIIANIFEIENSDRELFHIPKGLEEIYDISFTKLSLQLLVAVSSSDNGIHKELVDGFAIFSLADNASYYETVRKNVKLFEENIKEQIKNLEFKITIPRARYDMSEQPKPVLSSNWQEIDKYQNSQNKCFSFSSEDLLKVVDQIFRINPVVEESIINEDNQITISINKKMLLDSTDRQKIINSLIRQRDYKIFNRDKELENNVFLLYLYYNTSDEFVEKVVNFKKILNKYGSGNISLSWINEIHPEFIKNYRELLIASGEYDLLERLDMEKFMIKF